MCTSSTGTAKIPPYNSIKVFICLGFSLIRKDERHSSPWVAMGKEKISVLSDAFLEAIVTLFFFSSGRTDHDSGTKGISFTISSETERKRKSRRIIYDVRRGYESIEILIAISFRFVFGDRWYISQGERSPEYEKEWFPKRLGIKLNRIVDNFISYCFWGIRTASKPYQCFWGYCFKILRNSSVVVAFFISAVVFPGDSAWLYSWKTLSIPIHGEFCFPLKSASYKISFVLHFPIPCRGYFPKKSGVSFLYLRFRELDFICSAVKDRLFVSWGMPMFSTMLLPGEAESMSLKPYLANIPRLLFFAPIIQFLCNMLLKKKNKLRADHNWVLLREIESQRKNNIVIIFLNIRQYGIQKHR